MTGALPTVRCVAAVLGAARFIAAAASHRYLSVISDWADKRGPLSSRAFIRLDVGRST